MKSVQSWRPLLRDGRLHAELLPQLERLHPLRLVREVLLTIFFDRPFFICVGGCDEGD